MDDRRKERDKPKKCLVKILQNDMSELSLSNPLVFERATGKRKDSCSQP